MGLCARRFGPALTPVSGGVQGAECAYSDTEPGSVREGSQVTLGVPFFTNQSAVIFDARQWPVPVGLGLSAAKVEMRGSATQNAATTAFFVVFSGMLQSTNGMDSIKPEAFTQIQGSEFCSGITKAGFVSMSANNNHGSSADDFMRFDIDGSHGINRFGQMRTIDSTGVPVWIFFRMRKSVASPGTGTCFASIYATTGSAGNYRRGALLVNSASRDYSAISTSEGSVYFIVASAPTVSAGDVVYIQLTFATPGDAAAGSYIEVGMLSSEPGTPDNALVDGATGDLHGFLERTNFYSGKQIHEAAVASVTPSLVMTSLPFVDGTLYAWGSAKYSPDLTIDLLPLLEELMQHADYAGYIGLRLFHTAGVGKYISWHSAQSATATVGSAPDVGLDFGMQLTLEYEGVDSVQAGSPSAARGVLAYPGNASRAVDSGRPRVERR